MTKQELISKVAASSGHSIDTTEMVVETLFEQIKESVNGGETIYLRGFGCFKQKISPARLGYDFKNKKHIEVAEKKVPQFKPYWK